MNIRSPHELVGVLIFKETLFLMFNCGLSKINDETQLNVLLATEEKLVSYPRIVSINHPYIQNIPGTLYQLIG